MNIGAFIFIAIYIVSFIAHIIMLWIEKGNKFYRIGDVIDSIEFYMWFPILNTLMLLLVSIAVVGYGVYKFLKLDIAWNWLMNIKLKK